MMKTWQQQQQQWRRQSQAVAMLMCLHHRSSQIKMHIIWNIANCQREEVALTLLTFKM